MKEKVNLVPKLKDILNGCYDPNGGLAESGRMDNNGQPILEMKPWSDTNQPGGEVSLSPDDFEAFKILCRQTKYKMPEVTEVGCGGAVVPIRDLAALLSKTTAESVAEVAVELGE